MARRNRGRVLHRSAMVYGGPTPTDDDDDDFDFEELGRLVQRVGGHLLDPAFQQEMRRNPELKATVDELAALAGRAVEIIDFTGIGARVAPRYGLTEDQFWAIVISQGFACAICHRTFSPGGLKMVMDHNHATTSARGVLCSRCNTGLGQFMDSPDLLDAAIEYLDRYGCYGPDALDEDEA